MPAAPEHGSLEGRRRLDLAHVALRRTQYAQCAQLLDEARNLAPSNDQELRLEIETLRGWWAMETQPVQEAQMALSSAYDKAVELGDLYRQSALLNNLGIISARRSRYDEAIPFLERALDAAQRCEAYKYVGNLLGNLGICYSRLGDFEQALRYTLEAVARTRKANARSDLQSNLGKVGNIHYLKGDMPTAIRYYEEALAICRELSLRDYGSTWAANLASAYAEAGNWDAAEKTNRELRQFQTPDSLRRLEAQLRMNEAGIATGRGEFEGAATLYRTLLDPRSQHPFTVWEANAALGDIYSRLKRSDLASRHYEEALRIIETTHGKLLRNEYKITFLQGLIQFYRRYVDHLISRGMIERALEVADSSRARLLAERFGVHPQEFRTRNAADPRLLARDMGALLLAYWTGPAHSYVWVITPAEVRLSRLPPEGEIQELVDAWNSAIGNLRDPIADRVPAGERLSRMLLADVAGILQGSRRVVLVPDGPLHKLNFETLPVNGRAWIESAAIAIAPALRVLTRDRPRGPAQSVLVIGDPATASAEFPRLKHAPAEIAGVEAQFPSGKTARYTGAQATPARYFGSQPEDFSIIHFAAHAVANAQSPLDSAIILGEDGARSYKLYARDIVSRHLDAALVTISACRSAGVTSYAGEGLVGLAWAFLQTGARSVIGGLWDVADSSTAELMTGLYAGIAHGKDPVDGLRDAKLALLRSQGAYRKPYYWAPFQIYIRTRPWTRSFR